MSARDGYREYFTEKLWEWIPAIYRERDAVDGGDALRAFVSALGSRAALLKRSHDRLWDDQCIELADDWAIPYIADLVATRLVSALNTRARRTDVAKTIYYRRRKGTLAVLEQLIADMTGWDGKVVEEFRRLARLRHGLDGPARAGIIGATPEGGLADLRRVRGALLTGDPFDEFHYTPDVRRPAGECGRRGIAKLTFHLHRLHSVEFLGVRPFHVRAVAGFGEAFTFDPSGRETALFAANDPDRDWSGWRSAAEWQLPRPIDCRLLGETIFAVGSEEVAWALSAATIPPAQRPAAADSLRRLVGQRFVGRAAFTRVLAGMPAGATLTAAGVLAELFAQALIDECGSAALLPHAPGTAAFGTPAVEVSFAGGDTLLRERTRSANFDDWNIGGWTPTPVAMPEVDLFVDPERGRFVLDLQGNDTDDVRVRYRCGYAAPIAAGAYGRQVSAAAVTHSWQDGSSAAGTPAAGVVEIVDSDTYPDPPDQPAVTDCTIQARASQRPYISIADDWTFTAAGDDRHLRLDGLWIGARPGGELVLDGNFERVALRFCTLDPGGTDAAGTVLPPVAIVVRGFVEEMDIERCVLATLRLEGAGSIERLQIEDSIVHARQPLATAISAPRAHLTIRRSTVIGPGIDTLTVDVERLDASDTLIAGRVDATDTQNGCFRFSARGPGSRVPHPYESRVVTELGRLFSSRVFGDFRYAQLSPAAPPAIARGAQNDNEMGAFNAEIGATKLDSLRIKVDEYMPFGRLPNFAFEN